MKNKVDFLDGNRAKSIILFSIPMLIGNIFQQLYSTVDGVVVGKFVGKNAFRAISGTWSSVMLVLAIAIGFSNGISVVISQLYGARDFDKLKRAFSTVLIASVVITSVLTAAGLLVSKPLLGLLKIPQEIFADALLYVRIGFLTLFGTFAYNGLSGLLRATGDSKTPLYFLIVASFTNIVLDLLFVVKFGWGVAGAAWATAIGQIMSGLLATFTVFRMDAFKLKKGEWIYDKEMMSAVIKYSIPRALQMTVFSLGMMAVQGLVNSFGTDMIAAFSASNRIEDYAEMPIYNIASALAMFVGQNIGAGKHDRAKKGLYSTLAILGGVCVIAFFALPILARPAIGLFVNSNEVIVIETSIKCIKLLAVFFFVIAINRACSNFLRGAGDATFSMVISFATLAVRLPVAYYLASKPEIGYMAIWYSYIMGQRAGALVAIFRVISGKWKTKGMKTSKNNLQDA